MLFLQLFFSLLFTLAAGRRAQLESEAKSGRLLRIFSVVKFPNDGCNTTIGDSGVCYTVTKYRNRKHTITHTIFQATECSSLG